MSTDCGFGYGGRRTARRQTSKWICIELSRCFCTGLSSRRPMFVVVMGHCAVTHKRIIAALPDAVKMTIGLIVVAMWSTAVNVSIKKLKSFSDDDEAVKILCVQRECVVAVGHVVTARSNAVVMLFLRIDALVIRTQLAIFVLLEPVGDRRV